MPSRYSKLGKPPGKPQAKPPAKPRVQIMANKRCQLFKQMSRITDIPLETLHTMWVNGMSVKTIVDAACKGTGGAKSRAQNSRNADLTSTQLRELSALDKQIQVLTGYEASVLESLESTIPGLTENMPAEYFAGELYYFEDELVLRAFPVETMDDLVEIHGSKEGVVEAYIAAASENRR